MLVVTCADCVHFSFVNCECCGQAVGHCNVDCDMPKFGVCSRFELQRKDD